MSDTLYVSEVAALEGRPPHPAVLLLHGRGADEQDLLPLAGALDPRCRYVSARAPFPAGFGGYQWYGSQAIGRPDAGTFEQSLDLLSGLAERLAADAPVLVVCGFSQGAVMGLALFGRNPTIAGAAALSGYLALEPRALEGRPIFVAHGLFDPVIPVALAQQARRGLEAAGAAITYREYPMAHTTSEGELQDLRAWLGDRLG